MRKTEKGFVFGCTGREMYAANGFIGLDPFSGKDLEVSYGYDGTLQEEPPMTREEAHELANEMQARWKEWARKYDPEVLKEKWK